MAATCTTRGKSAPFNSHKGNYSMPKTEEVEIGSFVKSASVKVLVDVHMVQ